MITIAGSGPSTDQVRKVDVTTKKQSVPGDTVFCRFMGGFKRYDKGHQGDLMLYCRQCSCGSGSCYFCGTDAYYCDKKKWDAYYREFTRSKVHQKCKPSVGLCAVFGVVERWQPETVGLIGFDWVLDGYEDWIHDAVAERKCIESLVDIVDLRSPETGA